MTLREKITLEIMLRTERRDLEYSVSEFREVTEILVDFTDLLHTAKVKLDYWQQDLEIQLLKYGMHSYTYLNLLKGTQVKGRTQVREINYPDIGSIYLVKRALIENYLMFYYLNIQSDLKDESIFRYDLYKMSGLAQRQMYDVKNSEFAPKIAQELEQLEKLKAKIRGNSFFKSLKTEKQNYILNNCPAKIISWTQLIKDSHLKSHYFLNMWRLYSNYAHTEMIGAMQIKEYIKNPDQINPMLFNTTIVSLSLTSILIKDLVKMFKSIEISYNGLPEAITIKIDFWEKFGKE